MAMESAPTQALNFIPELSAPNPDAVKIYMSSFAETQQRAAYNDLLGYLLPEENKVFQSNVNDPNNVNMLALALQRRRNLQTIASGQNIPSNFTAIFNQMPAEGVSHPDDERLLRFLSPNERRQLKATQATEEGDEGVDNFLLRQGILAVAYNRLRQREAELAMEAEKVVEVTPLPLEPAPLSSMADTQPIKVKQPEQTGIVAKANWLVKTFFGYGREDNIGAARELLRQGGEQNVNDVQKMIDQLYVRLEANKQLPNTITNNLETYRLDRDFDGVLRELSAYKHRQKNSRRS